MQVAAYAGVSCRGLNVLKQHKHFGMPPYTAARVCESSIDNLTRTCDALTPLAGTRVRSSRWAPKPTIKHSCASRAGTWRAMQRLRRQTDSRLNTDRPCCSSHARVSCSCGSHSVPGLGAMAMARCAAAAPSSKRLRYRHPSLNCTIIASAGNVYCSVARTALALLP